MNAPMGPDQLPALPRSPAFQGSIGTRPRADFSRTALASANAAFIQGFRR